MGRDQVGPGFAPILLRPQTVREAVSDAAGQLATSAPSRNEQVHLTAEPRSHSGCMKLPCLERLL